MEAVTVSPKFQIVIPKTIRRALDIRPGQKVQLIQYGERIEVLPLRDVCELRGFLAGIETTVEREGDRL